MILPSGCVTTARACALLAPKPVCVLPLFPKAGSKPTVWDNKKVDFSSSNSKIIFFMMIIFLSLIVFDLIDIVS